MEKIIKILQEIREINSAYQLSNDIVDANLKTIQSAKVCTPIIGKFSTGKSALVNTVLGYSKKILKEDITPETAVPVEIVYDDTEDSVTIYNNEDSHRSIEVAEYRTVELDANTTKCVRLRLRNNYLEDIPDVMLVDMPGFESGYDIHNKAIDDYLPQSLAYIVAFSAEDMIVRSSVGNILKELCLHDMPICVVITKYDKRNDEFETTFTKFKDSLKRFIGSREVKYCFTSSFTGDAEELKEFLCEIQSQSQMILKNNFKPYVLNAANITESYLNAILKNNDLSESELEEKEEKLGKELNVLEDAFVKERDDFNSQISNCVEEIKADVRVALEAEEATFIAMAMNNQDISEHLNTTIRNAVTTSIKKRFIPKVEKYLKKVENCIDANSFSDVSISLNINVEQVSKGIISSTVAIVAAAWIMGPISGVIITGITALYNKLKAEKKREEMKNQIHMQLRSDVYPNALAKVGNGIEMAITKQLMSINNSIDVEISAQRAALEKAMSDLKKQKEDEQLRKENYGVDVKEDLQRIGVLKNEL